MHLSFVHFRDEFWVNYKEIAYLLVLYSPWVRLTLLYLLLL